MQPLAHYHSTETHPASLGCQHPWQVTANQPTRSVFKGSFIFLCLCCCAGHTLRQVGQLINLHLGQQGQRAQHLQVPSMLSLPGWQLAGMLCCLHIAPAGSKGTAQCAEAVRPETLCLPGARARALIARTTSSSLHLRLQGQQAQHLQALSTCPEAGYSATRLWALSRLLSRCCSRSLQG